MSTFYVQRFWRDQWMLKAIVLLNFPGAQSITNCIKLSQLFQVVAMRIHLDDWNILVRPHQTSFGQSGCTPNSKCLYRMWSSVGTCSPAHYFQFITSKFYLNILKVERISSLRSNVAINLQTCILQAAHSIQFEWCFVRKYMKHGAWKSYGHSFNQAKKWTERINSKCCHTNSITMRIAYWLTTNEIHAVDKKRANKSEIERKKKMRNAISVSVLQQRTDIRLQIFWCHLLNFMGALARSLQTKSDKYRMAYHLNNFNAAMKQIWILKNKMANTLHRTFRTRKSNYKKPMRSVRQTVAGCICGNKGLWKWPDHPFQFIPHACRGCIWYWNAIFALFLQCQVLPPPRLPICFYIKSFSKTVSNGWNANWSITQCAHQNLIFLLHCDRYGEMAFGFTSYSSRKQQL